MKEIEVSARLTSLFSNSTQLVESMLSSLSGSNQTTFPHSVFSSFLQVLPSKSRLSSILILFSADRNPPLPRLSVVDIAPESLPSVTETDPEPSLISIASSLQASSSISPVESRTIPSISSPTILTFDSITLKFMLSPYLSSETVNPELRWRKIVALAVTRMTTTTTAAVAFHLSPSEDRVGIVITKEGWSSSGI